MSITEPTFYEEDGDEIIDAITYIMEHKTVRLININLEGGKKARLYWEKSTLRIDIEGLVLEVT